MYDSVTWSAIPTSAPIVAGYINGIYAWPASAWARFPDARKVRITITASANDGDVLDVEQGDATPQEARGWIIRRQASGLAVPTIYCSSSAMAQVAYYCGDLKYDVWSAHYNGVPHIELGCVATQWADPYHGSGGNWDISLCQPWWPRS